MILDVTVGAGSIYAGWNKKLEDNLVGIDIRKGDFSYKFPANWSQNRVIIRPTVQADMKQLPFRDRLFEAIIFDPPHIACGLTGWIGKRYGSWTQRKTIQTLRAVDKEFKRVLQPGGLLILKIIPRSFLLYETLLKNFIFFLPIRTIRRRGNYKNPLKGEGALWAIGQVKP